MTGLPQPDWSDGYSSQIPGGLVNDHRISPLALGRDILVYAALDLLMQAGLETSHTQISWVTGQSRGTITTAIIDLERHGWITTLHAAGAGRPAEYRLNTEAVAR